MCSPIYPTACVAGLKNLEIIRREGLLEQAKHVGERLSDGLHALAADGLLAEVRGLGGMWAATLGDNQSAMPARDAMLDNHGVIVRALNDALVFCPPLVITDEQIDRIIDAVEAAVR